VSGIAADKFINDNFTEKICDDDEELEKIQKAKMLKNAYRQLDVNEMTSD
jgi:hypothetical protein